MGSRKEYLEKYLLVVGRDDSDYYMLQKWLRCSKFYAKEFGNIFEFQVDQDETGEDDEDDLLDLLKDKLEQEFLKQGIKVHFYKSLN